jgi:hypothetical protein
MTTVGYGDICAITIGEKASYLIASQPYHLPLHRCIMCRDVQLGP